MESVDYATKKKFGTLVHVSNGVIIYLRLVEPKPVLS